MMSDNGKVACWLAAIVLVLAGLALIGGVCYGDDGYFDQQGYFRLLPAGTTEAPPLAALGFSAKAQRDILANHKPVYTQVSADWCQPCKALEAKYPGWCKPHYYQHYNADRHAPILRSLRIAIGPVPRLIVWAWRGSRWIRTEYVGVPQIERYIRTLTRDP